MSVKFTVELELPLEDIANIQAGANTASSQQIVLAANKATVTAIRALPYRVTSATTATAVPAPVITTVADAKPVYPSQSMQLFVVITTTGRILTLNLPSSSIVEDLKYLVQDMEGLPPDTQRCIFAGRQLEGGRCLGDYGIQSNSTVHLTTILRGS